MALSNRVQNVYRYYMLHRNHLLAIKRIQGQLYTYVYERTASLVPIKENEKNEHFLCTAIELNISRLILFQPYCNQQPKVVQWRKPVVSALDRFYNRSNGLYIKLNWYYKTSAKRSF